MNERIVTPKIILAIKSLSVLAVVSALGGCASLSYPLPKCDGYNKRPLNRSMWEWDAERPAEQSRLSGGEDKPLAFASGNKTPVAFASFNEAASTRACGQG